MDRSWSLDLLFDRQYLNFIILVFFLELFGIFLTIFNLFFDFLHLIVSKFLNNLIRHESFDRSATPTHKSIDLKNLSLHSDNPMILAKICCIFHITHYNCVFHHIVKRIEKFLVLYSDQIKQSLSAFRRFKSCHPLRLLPDHFFDSYERSRTHIVLPKVIDARLSILDCVDQNIVELWATWWDSDIILLGNTSQISNPSMHSSDEAFLLSMDQLLEDLTLISGLPPRVLHVTISVF